MEIKRLSHRYYLKYILTFIIGIIIGLCLSWLLYLINSEKNADIDVVSYSAPYAIESYVDYHIEYDNVNDVYLGEELGYEKLANYTYKLPSDSAGELYINMVPDELVYDGVKFYRLNDNYLIMSYMSDTMYHNRLKYHMLDQLVYLDKETATADVRFECSNAIRILYGNDDFVIVYHAQSNCYRYIYLDTGNVFKVVKSNINSKRGEYDVEVYETDNYINIVKRNWFWNNLNIVVDTLDLSN